MKKNYYINTLLKTIRFLILGISVCLIVIAACLVTDGKISPASMILFIILGILLCMTIIIYFFKIMPSYYFYLGLCSSFNNGEIHRKFFEKIPDLFPGIGGSFERLDSLLKEQDTLKLSTRQAEFLALQNQINPHFLYNTLDTINWMAIDKDEYEISNMIGTLANILRYGISDSNGVVKIKDEVEWLKQYIFLQQTKLKNSFACHINVQPELMGLSIHKLLLQPFIENAILHGFEGVDRTHVLQMDMGREEDWIVIRIQDNGCGIPDEMVREMNEGIFRKTDNKNHIGMENAITRIHMYYGDSAEVRMESQLGQGTTVQIRIPVNKEREPSGETADTTRMKTLDTL